MTTITIDKELLEQVLAALETMTDEYDDSAVGLEIEAIHALRAALSAPATAPEPSTEVAVGKLCKSLREDLDYAWTWHCNIAMAAFDAGCPHDVANEGAARFMQLLAGVDTREHPAFQGTQDHPMRNDKTAPAQPAWHDAPTVPGTWILSLDSGMEVQENITQHEIDIEATWPGGRWYGPIPEDKP